MPSQLAQPFRGAPVGCVSRHWCEEHSGAMASAWSVAGFFLTVQPHECTRVRGVQILRPRQVVSGRLPPIWSR
jgi:hypothetical protein